MDTYDVAVLHKGYPLATVREKAESEDEAADLALNAFMEGHQDMSRQELETKVRKVPSRGF